MAQIEEYWCWVIYVSIVGLVVLLGMGLEVWYQKQSKLQQNLLQEYLFADDY